MKSVYERQLFVENYEYIMLFTVRALEAGGHGVPAGLEIRVFQKTGPPLISATDSGHNIKESKQ